MTVKVKWERPDGRRQLSVTAPLFVDQGPRRVRALEWGLVGLVYPAGSRGLPRIEDEVDLRLAIPFQGFEVAFPVRAKVVAVDPAEEVVTAEFIELGDREREVMRHFIDELVRGVMSEVDQTIQRLDIPAMSALPVAFDPPFETTPPQQAPRWTARAAVVAALAAVAVILLGWQAAGRILHFEVDRAVLSIPSQPLLAGAEGYLVWNGVRSGQTVATGDTIARIADIGLEREIALAELAVREREAQLALFRQRSSADDRRGAVVKVPASLRSFHPTAAGTSPGEVEILLEFARERHAALVAQRERLVVRAPGDGVLLDLAAAHQVSVRKGDPVAVIAPPQADPTITVWLTPAETLSVAVGDRAVLWLPRTRTSATARVVSMQWGSGLGSGEISPTGTGAHEAGSEHRWTKVVLRLEEPRSVPALEQAATGLPVVVSFERAWAVNAVASLRQTAAQAASVVRDGLKRAFSRPHAAASLSHE